LFVCCQLYEEFCEPFNLWECKLAIIHCSGHCDLALVETIWLNIIESELQACASISSNDMMTVLVGKMKALGQEYAGSLRCFPVREYRDPGRCRCDTVAAYKIFAGKLLSVKTASWH
jgi:nuclear pore complex protein Nup155